MFATDTPYNCLFINNWAELDDVKHQMNSDMDFKE